MQANGCENNHDGDDTHVSNGSCNGTSSVPTANSSRKKMSKKDMDIVRLIGQHLRNLGLNRTAEQLIVESGCSLEHPSAAKFRSHVMEGRWDLAETSLSDFKDLVLHEDGLLRMRFLVLEQKYLELLEDSRLLEALNVLRQQLTPLHYCTERVHTLTTYMMCSTAEELRETAKWEGKGPISRQKVMERLHEFLPANVILPPRRLDTLISQAVELQQERCPYHNSKTTDTDDCLLVDHQCSQEHMPNVTIQLLTDHPDEVWFCRFSPDGNKLATGCKSGQLILWNVDKKRFTVQKWKVLDGHSYGVSTIAWSTDSKYIIVCGPDDCADLWIWNAETGILKTKMNNSPEDSLTTASFYNDSYQFIVAGTRGQFFHCDLEGHVLDQWEGVRVQCVQCSNDHVTVYAADTHHRIRAYNFEDVSDQDVLMEDHAIMSFCLNDSCELALLNVAQQGVHLWSVKDKILVRKFQGLSQGYYTIYSCFGGLNNNFIASGSEDNKIYLWHIRKEEPIATLSGHSRTVNCVHWNPSVPEMLASVSDDSTVRIWAPAAIQARNGTATPI